MVSRKWWYLFYGFFIIGIVVPVVISVDTIAVNNARNERELEIINSLVNFKARLESELAGNLNLLKGLTALIVSNPDLNEEEFMIYARALHPEDRGVVNFAVAPDLVIKYVYPVEGNELAIGLDYRTNEAQWPVVKQTVETGRLVVAGPLELVQGGQAILGRSPVYVDDPATGGKRLWGLVSLPLRLDDLLKNAGYSELHDRIRVAIRGRDSRGPEGEVFAGDPELFEKDPVIVDVMLPTGSWQIAGAPIQEFGQRELLLLVFRITRYLVIGLLLVIIILAHKSFREQKRAREKLGKVNATLEEKVEEISLLNSDIESFSHSVSHDLRAPLFRIMNFAQLLREIIEDSGNVKASHYLSRIESSSRRMSNLINDLVRLSRASKQEIHREQTDLSIIAMEVLWFLQESEPGRKVEADIQEGIEASCDPGLMRVVLENLFDNAWKFTSNTERARIRFSAREENSELVIAVGDNGAGFDQSLAGDIFQPFKRLHDQTEYGGTGIGLVTVQKIISRHGGRIWVESETGAGTTVFFTLGPEG